jgi:hypothetical protein
MLGVSRTYSQSFVVFGWVAGVAVVAGFVAESQRAMVGCMAHAVLRVSLHLVFTAVLRCG